ncbi:MAG TPA: DUF1501 domain-containing protein [Bryobacteraceae bacterium]|jgi:hypothetical protein|nr:DUF1501 domain-containing protein [Bryobacteraceae bacterium]
MENRKPCSCPGPRYLTAFGRRSFIQVGVLGGLGLCLPELFRATARASVVRPATGGVNRPEGPAKSVIQIILPGGLAHQESWDPKPEAPIEYRGPLGVVKTKIPGIVLSENLARTAQIADKITIVRSITGRIPDHAQATYQMFTGYLPTPAIQHPSLGAVVANQFGPRKNLPAYVGVPNVPPAAGTGYLSSKFGAFELGGDPGRRNFQVRDIALPKGIDESRFERRRTAREAIEDHFRQAEANPAELDAMDEFYQQAYKLISSPEARRAFSLEGEPEAMTKLYGEYRNPRGGGVISVGRQLMLARRLVEAGVRLVTVMYNGTDGWDNHLRIKDAVANGMPAFDHAFAGLIADLDQRGLLDSTLVMVTSEFGRTPKINENAGRDHWARVYSYAAAGGGIARGAIYGASNATASEPDENPVSVEDFLATVYHQLGIDSTDRLLAPGGRPIDIVRDGKVVQGLLA